MWTRIIPNTDTFHAVHVYPSISFDDIIPFIYYHTVLKKESYQLTLRHLRKATDKSILQKYLFWKKLLLSCWAVLISMVMILDSCGGVDFSKVAALELMTFWTGIWISLQLQILHQKCPYSELFWYASSHIRTEYEDILRISE